MEPSTIAMLNGIYRAAPTGIGMVRNRVFCQVNDRVCTITGYSREELIGQSSRMVYPSQEEYDQVGRDKYDQVRRLGVGSVETRWQRKDGTILDILLSSSPLNPDDLAEGVIFTATDITKHKKAEAALAESESKFRAIASQTPDHIIIQDLDLRYTYVVNPQLGLTEADMIGKTDRDFLPAAEAEKLIAAKRKVLQTGQSLPFAVAITNRKGKLEYFEGSYIPKFDADRRIDGLIGYFRNVTEQKQAELAIRLSEERFHLLFEQAPLGYQSLDENGRFIEVNKTWLDALGYSRQEVVGKWFGDFLAPEFVEAFRQRFSLFKCAGKIHSEFQMLHKNGQRRYIAFEGRIGYKPDGSFKQTHCILSDITEQKRAADALRESETLLRESQIVAGLGSYVLDIPTGLWVSSAVLDTVFGIDPAYQRSVDGWTALIHPDDRQQMSDYFTNEVLGKGVRFDKEYRILRHDNQVVRWVHGLGNLEFDAHGRPLKMYGTIQDITERKRAEKALAHSHDLMRYIIEHNRSAVAVHDRDLRYIYVSQRYLDDYKVKEKDVIGKHHYEIFPDLPQKWRDVHQRALAGEVCSAEDDPYYREDGTVDWTRWECRPWYQADGSIGGIIIYTEVVTERKKSEEALRESQRRLSTLMSNLPGIAYRCLNNRDWTMEFISEGCMALTGYPAADLVESAKVSYNDIIIPEDREMVWETVQQALSEKRPYQITYRIRTAEGAVRWVWEQGRGVYDETGTLESLEGFVADMTARILAEQQREQLLKDLQAKTEELESIIYVSSHDLRSPLVNIQGFSGELGESCRQIRKLLAVNTVAESDHQQLDELLGQDIPAAIEYITTSVSKLDALQKGLLKICRIGRESLEIAPVAMNDLIDGVLKSTRYLLDNCQAQVIVEPLPNCLADAGQLTQVFTNLIDNAIKYRSPDRPLQIRIYGRVEDANSVYAVADNGVGIAPEYQERVFEMFHQLDPINGPGGEGLGLTIVKRILGRMDGQVRLESAPGVGSAFFVLLPKA